LEILAEYIPDKNIMRLLENVIGSFYSTRAGVGLPLGNLTSQLFVNVYMNKFDQFAKHKLRAEFYIRYADDFVILSSDKKWLENKISEIEKFLREVLRLEMHPNKIHIKTFSSGVDFLGMVNFSSYRILRTKTKRRMLKKLSLKHKMCREELASKGLFEQSLQSYLGILKHCNGRKIRKEIDKITKEVIS
jgi:RNA-directed DNA polymerase